MMTVVNPSSKGVVVIHPTVSYNNSVIFASVVLHTLIIFRTNDPSLLGRQPEPKVFLIATNL